MKPSMPTKRHIGLQTLHVTRFLCCNRNSEVVDEERYVRSSVLCQRGGIKVTAGFH